tara:strand:- start:498 stop:1220 length:723 start_codon:yes stop_codon:yes gene_type:complete
MPTWDSLPVLVKLGGAETQVNASTGENLYLTGAAGSKNLSETNQGGSITTADGTVYKESTSTAAGSIDTTNAFKFDMDGDTTGTTGDQYILKDDNTYTSGFSGDNSLSASANATVYLNDNGKITDGAANEIFSTADGELTKDAVSNSTVTKDPLAALDAALNQVDSLRSDLGAVQNRFDSAITNLQTNETNLSAARSRIEDADYATEVANMTRAQILQQAGTSVLAQANQIPQNVLSLLG